MFQSVAPVEALWKGQVKSSVNHFENMHARKHRCNTCVIWRWGEISKMFSIFENFNI